MRRLADLPLGWKLHGAFALVVLILLALSGVALETIAANQREAAAVERTERVIGQANAALSSLVDMETGFRGYLIAGQSDYLEPYTSGRTRFELQMARLIRETADDPAQVARWQEIERGAMAWEAQTVEPAIAQRRTAGPDAPIPPDVVARIRDGDGKAQFDRVRLLFDQAIADQQATLAARTGEAADANARLRTTLAVGSALGVLLALALAAALSRDVVRAVGQLAAAAGRVAGGHLDERVGLRRGDEIGRAAAAVDRMADELRQLIGERDRILASVGDGIVRLDAEGGVQFANAAAARMLGYEVDELIGQPFWEVVQRGSEGVFWRRDGTTFQVELTSAPVLEGERVVGAVVDFRDVSEREQLRAEQVARTGAEVALRERNDVLAAVSHDLKTPLTSVRGISQLLARRLTIGDPPTREEVLEWAARIQDASARMTRLLDDLLDASRLQAGHALDLRPVPTDLAELAARLASECQRQSSAHNVRVECTAKRAIGYWDSARLERVVANLLSNAVKYSPDGGEVVVRVRSEDVGDRAWAVLSILDHGVGIPAADLPHLFEPYFRAGNVAGAIPGHGLGLAGARRIVEQHGGAIDVESVEGFGSTFTVRLPMDASAVPATAA